MTEFNVEWLEMLKGIGARNMIWGVQGGNEWISYKQNCDNDFSVQIFTHDGFEVYKTQKNAIVDFFQNRNSVLVSERDVKDVAFGYWKQLEFIDQDKFNLQIKEKEDMLKKFTSTNIGTQINGSVDTNGGSFNTGNGESIDNSTTNSIEDEKWFQKEIVKMILSFIGGIGTTLVAQWLMRLLGWI